MIDSAADVGAGLHVLRLCSVYEPAAHPAPAPGGDLDARAARFDPVGGMQNHTGALTSCLDAQGHRQTVVTSRLAAARGTTRAGSATRIVRVGAPIPVLRQLWAPAALPHVLRPAGRVDVVHAHQGEDLAALPLGWLAARRHGAPLVVTVHCSVRHTVRGRSLRARVLRRLGGHVERAVLRRADAVIVLTPRTKLGLSGDGIPTERIRIIPSGFDPSLFARARRGGDALAGTGRPRIGYVGRLAPQKRADLLVEAFGRMREHAHLVLVGDGPERSRIDGLVARSRAAGRISVFGFVPHTEVPGILAALDVLVLPSAYEEMGSVLVEAMAAGLPVVASDVGGIPDVVRDGETGLLVPPGDVAALTAALDRVIGDDALRAHLAEVARRHARGYGWPDLSAQVTAVYTAARDRAARSRDASAA